jgi:hypothetical protein
MAAAMIMAMETVTAMETAMETVTATETVTVTATIEMPTPMLTTVHQRQQRGRHARDVPRGGGSGGNVGGGGGGRNCNGRGGSDSGSRRGGQWAGWAGAEQCIHFYFSIRSVTTTTIIIPTAAGWTSSPHRPWTNIK